MPSITTIPATAASISSSPPTGIGTLHKKHDSDSHSTSNNTTNTVNKTMSPTSLSPQTMTLKPDHEGHQDSQAPPHDNSDQYSTDEEQEQKLAEIIASGVEPSKAVLRQTTTKAKKSKRDVFSTLPDNVLRMILSLLQPHQMLTLSELSRKFYEFIVLGQEMNEVWFRLVQQEQAEARKREEWFMNKLREQEHRAVQMARTFSGSSAFSSSGYSSLADDDGLPMSNQQKRLVKKKDSSVDKIKVMRRSDRKKNWCKIYVDTVLRGIEEEKPVRRRQRDSAMGNTPVSKPVAKFQTITLNASLPEPEELQGREAVTQNKIEKRAYYKSIRAKPKGKKPGQDSHSNHERIGRAHSHWENDESIEY